jgi:hypothetical protein
MTWSMAVLSILPTFPKNNDLEIHKNSYTEEVGKQFPSITEATAEQASQRFMYEYFKKSEDAAKFLKHAKNLMLENLNV